MTASRIAEARGYLIAKGRRIAGAPTLRLRGGPSHEAVGRGTRRSRNCDSNVRLGFREGDAIADCILGSTSSDGGRRTTIGGLHGNTRQILFTLSNNVYAGLVLDGLGFREGCHQGLVDKSVYHEVQNILASRRTRTPGRRNGSLPWPLRGLVVCGTCGRVLSTHTIRRGTVIYRYYRCRSTASGREPCRGVLISAHEIETAV